MQKFDITVDQQMEQGTWQKTIYPAIYFVCHGCNNWLRFNVQSKHYTIFFCFCFSFFQSSWELSSWSMVEVHGRQTLFAIFCHYFSRTKNTQAKRTLNSCNSFSIRAAQRKEYAPWRVDMFVPSWESPKLHEFQTFPGLSYLLWKCNFVSIPDCKFTWRDSLILSIASAG